VRFARTARKHRIGRFSARHVINSTTPIEIPGGHGFDARLVWIGPDERGRVLEIVALVLQDEVLVIHVMPTAYRR
jgi:hypothetical protein